MITAYRTDHDGAVSQQSALESGGAANGAVWLDAFNPDEAEAAALHLATGMEIPTWEEMSEIELSSRLRLENGCLTMIAHLIPKSEAKTLPTRPVAFVLQKDRLVTVRRDRFPSFERTAGRCAKGGEECPSSALEILCALLDEAVSDRADSLELVIKAMDELAEELFSLPRTSPGKADRENPTLRELLRRIGETGEILSNVRESLASVQRVAHFLRARLPINQLGENAAALDSVNSDIVALSDEASFLMNRLSFYLDATLGMINIEENQIVKVLSAVALIFCPPMLIASVYGMNFANMPELRWEWGYFLALAGMGAAIGAQFWYLRKRKWF